MVTLLLRVPLNTCLARLIWTCFHFFKYLWVLIQFFSIFPPTFYFFLRGTFEIANFFASDVHHLPRAWDSNMPNISSWFFLFTQASLTFPLIMSVWCGVLDCKFRSWFKIRRHSFKFNQVWHALGFNICSIGYVCRPQRPNHPFTFYLLRKSICDAICGNISSAIISCVFRLIYWLEYSFRWWFWNLQICNKACIILGNRLIRFCWFLAIAKLLRHSRKINLYRSSVSGC